MRALNAQEQESVSGALLPEVPVRGRRIRDPLFDPLRTGFFGGDQYLDTLLMTQRPGVGGDDGGGGGGEERETPRADEASKGTHEMDPAKLLEFWENLIGSLSVPQQAALSAALLAAAKNAFLSPHSQALAALSGAVSAGNANMAADIHYAANSQGYGLKMDAAIKGVLDKVRSGR